MQGIWLVDAEIAEHMNIDKSRMNRAINSSCIFHNNHHHFSTGGTLFNNKVKVWGLHVSFYFVKEHTEQGIDPTIYLGTDPQWTVINDRFSSKKSVGTQPATRKRKSPNNSNSNTSSTTNSKRPKLHIPVSIYVLKMEQLKLAWSNMYKDNVIVQIYHRTYICSSYVHID